MAEEKPPSLVVRCWLGRQAGHAPKPKVELALSQALCWSRMRVCADGTQRRSLMMTRTNKRERGGKSMSTV